MFKDLSLFIIKPNAIKKNVIGEIISMIEKDGLRIVALKSLWMDEEQAKAFYIVHRGKEFYESLCKFMSSGPIVVGIVKGESAVKRLRKIMGETDPKVADKDTIRGRFGDDIQKNAIHGSDSLETAEREIKFFFSENEIIKLLRER